MPTRSNPELPPLLVRADAGPRQGSGHVMRSLALAHEWSAHGGQVCFVTVQPRDELRRRMESIGARVVVIENPFPHPADLESTLDTVARLRARSVALPWMILDGYHFDFVYQRKIRSTGCRLLVVDDNAHLSYYDADIVLNHGIHGPHIDYCTNDDAWCLLGTRYALLRPEFHPWRAFQRHVESRAKNILVTLGGGDADNLTRKVLRALLQVDDVELEVKVLIGALNPHADELRALVATSRNIAVHSDASDPASLMAWADMAIAAGGTTAWELAFMQLPALLLVLADNQEGVAAGIDHFGAARSLGRGDRLDEATIAAEVKKKAADVALLRRMAAQGRRLVDGLGVERILSAMAEREAFFSTANFYLRPATPDDRLLLWQWANDPVVRRSSFHTQAIDWTEHEAWYVEKLASPDCRIWIMHIGALPVGQIRYERIGGDAAEISFSIARGFRGKQLGTRLLEASGEQALRELGVRWLQGAVRIDNEASCRAFLKAGFDRTKQEGRDGTPHWLFRRAAHVNGWLEDYVAVH